MASTVSDDIWNQEKESPDVSIPIATGPRKGRHRVKEEEISVPYDSEKQVEGAIPEIPARVVKDLVQVFKLLSDETRLRILLFLANQKELHVRALCEQLGQSQPAVSHHLALLRVAGLIEPRREGKHNYYSIMPERFQSLLDMVFKVMPQAAGKIRFEDFTMEYEADREEEPSS
ncbi:HTH-type transcriptional regulator KmtR [Planctomycetales bacterium 10988]|nr:HTH-type transcriptional regulator KmtR [Planctomycetales bacterium 10988]